MPPTSVDAASDESKKRKATPGALLQRKIPRLDAGQIQYLPAHEKDQIKISATGYIVVQKQLLDQPLSHQ